MAMSILNSRSTQVSLSELQKNSTIVSNTMARVMNGQKINDAADDASQYSVSERMRDLIRGLEQAGQNVQNDSAMLKTAEAAAASTLEIIKTLKEKAIQAANDDNTDMDRAVIQKEVDQLIDQVNDNALVTFNGKYLLDGSSSPLYSTATDAKEAVLRGLNSSWLRNSLDMIKDTYGLGFDSTNASVHSMTVYLDDEGDDGTLAYVSHVPIEGRARQLELHVNMQYYSELVKTDPNGSSKTEGAILLDRTIVHEMTHAVMAANIKYFSELPGFVKEGGSAELIHGADDIRNLEDTGDDYAGGFVKMRYMAHQSSLDPRTFVKTFMKCLADSNGQTAGLNYAIRTASHGAFRDVESFEEQFANDISAAGGYEEFLRLKCGIILEDKDVGAITGWDAGSGPVKDQYNTVREASRPANWRMPTSYSSLINGLEVIWPANSWASEGGGLAFQVGARSNERLNVGLFNMTAQYIGLTDENGFNISVRTQKDANEMINHLNHVLEVVLDQQTMIGALQQRLEETAGTVGTSTDNVRAAESTIRDADMAKEITALNNAQVLEQAAQSMLTKSNENLADGLKSITSAGAEEVDESVDATSAKSSMDENLSAVGKDLQKITNGQKINSAADDASAYSISEKMRVEIRGLEQDVNNVQNGHCILNIAEKAIDEQVQIVGRLHDIGLRASDAACNQLDRDVLQKEVTELVDQLEQIAQNTMYNGKRLLNGMTDAHRIVRTFNNFDPLGSENDNDIDIPWPDETPLMSVPLNIMMLGTNTDGEALKPSDLDMQGVSLKCDACDQFVSILFDASRGLGEAMYFRDRSYDANGTPNEKYHASEAYIVGIGGAQTFEDVFESMFQGIARANDTNPTLGMQNMSDNEFQTGITGWHNVRLTKTGEPPEYSFTRTSNNFVMYNGFKGDMDMDVAPGFYPRSDLSIQGTTRDSMNTNFTLPNTTLRVLFPSADDNGLLFLPDANEFPYKGASCDAECVRTWEKAENFVRDTDAALKYLLNCSANIGAQARRMDYMVDNVETMRDNVTAAESAIRDADMAKEFTKFARDNVLMQASEAMFTQVINNPRRVMGLIA